MPDFNKGDFTQQGVAGHVNANLRLNEKRLVNIDMTSNEEAEGCTITGTVKDLLNDKVYGIGSGVSGNIEITENGENINVAPYATATVNVSGGGGNTIHICTLTVINNSGSEIYLGDYVSMAPIYVEGGFINSEYQAFIPDNETLTLQIVCQYFEPATDYMAFMLGEGSGILSNNINCEQGEGEFEPLVLVIDNTQDCSATLTISGNV